MLVRVVLFVLLGFPYDSPWFCHVFFPCFGDSTPGAAPELSASNGPGKLPGALGVVGVDGGGWWMRSWWNLPLGSEVWR